MAIHPSGKFATLVMEPRFRVLGINAIMKTWLYRLTYFPEGCIELKVAFCN